MDAFGVPVALLIAAAGVGFVPTFLIERYKRRHAMLTRWDEPFLQLCSEFASSVRNFLHLVQRRREIKGTAELAAHDLRIDEEHSRVRSLSEQIRLLGNRRVQFESRTTVHHAYAVRSVAKGEADPHPEYEVDPEDRLVNSLTAFFIAARVQLRVAEAEQVYSRDS